VKLNCGPGQASADGSDEKEPETKKFELTALDAFDKPLANKRYELAVGDARFKGQTDGSGTIKQKVPKAATTANVSIWLNDKNRIDYVVDIEKAPPVTEVKGAQIRLRNLGYYEGDVTGELDEETKAALRLYQEDYELEVTGELDGPTQGQLTKMSKF